MRKLLKFFSIKKESLILVAAFLWLLVGIYLIYLAINWLRPYDNTVYEIIGGIILGLLIATLGFQQIVRKNVKRIMAYKKDKICIFAFQKFQSYVLIVVVVSLGAYLKSSEYVTKNYLAIMYMGIGLALFLCSILYLIRYLENSTTIPVLIPIIGTIIGFALLLTTITVGFVIGIAIIIVLGFVFLVVEPVYHALR